MTRISGSYGRQAQEQGVLQELSADPWLLTALGLGTLLTAFLMAAHACCVGLSTPHLSALISICSSAGS